MPSEKHWLIHTPMRPTGSEGRAVHPDDHHVVAPCSRETRRVSNADVRVPIERRRGLSFVTQREDREHHGMVPQVLADGKIEGQVGSDARAEQDRG